MENQMKESSFIEQIMVIGENQKHPAALVQPSFEFLQDYCKKNNITYESGSKILENEIIKARFIKEIDRLNESFAQYAKIKKFRK